MSATKGFSARLPLALRFALRDLSGDLRGFSVFIACIVIGVAAISGVGAVSQSLSQGLAREGRVILGGDVSVSLTARRLKPAERDVLATAGRLSEIALMRAMARAPNDEAALIEIKAVDAAYPTVGAVTLAPALPLAGALDERGGVFGLVADSTLIARLDLKIGDRVRIGVAALELRGELADEPDKLAGGIGFGARALMSEAALRATGLLQPGAIVRFQARVSLGDGASVASDADIDRFAERLSAAFPDAGWEVRRRDAVSPQFSRNQERFTQLLTLVALTALVAGGAGVANAVDGFVARKRDAFAILKALGAPASRVFAMALIEVTFVAAIAIAGGLALGATLPFVVDAALAASIGLPYSPSVDPRSLATAALYGLLVTLVFALVPLGRAYDTPVARLLRDEAEETRPPRRFLIAALGAAGLLITLVTALSADRRLAATYIVATAAAFVLLRGVAALVTAAARRAPRVASARLRHAIGAIRRPKSLAPALIVSIGLTQTLLVALTLIEGSIHAELERTQKGQTPSFFFVDTPKDEVGAFETFLSSFSSDARVEHVPMMRGRIVAVKGVRAESLHPGDDVAWALEGDRGVTFSATPPNGSTIVAGAWWPADFAGPPQVSLEARVAEGLGLAVGDEIVVNALGRDVTAKIANLRRLDWRSYGINFMMVFSPDTFADAPYSEIFTVAFADREDAARDARLTRAAAARFPTIAALRVKDALEAVEKIADQLTFAARAAAGLAIVTAALALGSAVATSQRARLHDAVVLKTLGATRGWLTSAYLIELAALGTIAAVFAVAAGAGVAAFILEGLMRMSFVFRPWPVALTILGALVFAVGLGLAGGLRTLGQRPGPALRRP
jgi:putative ABC transport system permease protein